MICAKPRFIIAILVISGVLLVAIPLRHHVGPMSPFQGSHEGNVHNI